MQTVQAASNECANSEPCTENNSIYDRKKLMNSEYDYIYNQAYNCEKITTEKNSAYDSICDNNL